MLPYPTTVEDLTIVVNCIILYPIYIIYFLLLLYETILQSTVDNALDYTTDYTADYTIDNGLCYRLYYIQH